MVGQVPPIVSFLASSPLVTKEHLASLREVIGITVINDKVTIFFIIIIIMKVVCGAAPCGASLISQFMKKAPESLLFKEGWGMTEVILSTISN